MQVIRSFSESAHEALRRAAYDAPTRDRIFRAHDFLAAAIGDFRETGETLRESQRRLGPAPVVAAHAISIGRSWSFTVDEIRRAGLTLGEARAAGVIR